ncbi:HEPN domain-containing protein [Algoriphagus sp. D3-2-R+10]|uniref:HEPN domain-containing protein n=1 Tax=Algoriphagus aurantiacus TaxID=3103948 RepID=UPI002B3A84B1|nr:HEPN domain-containing protein [Algoriphagus sp. D3-2-R+10]MEB2778599.1 HEPN domain-containing protein [Algoriphagus sp. D3-2-R+10]
MDLSEKLQHLPPKKQDEIAKALDIILEVANPEKVILFGSYAKGKWVDDITVEDGVTFVYRSDFDFLVVIKDNSIKEYELKSKIENRAINSVMGIVSALVHSIDYINEGLSYDQYFFKQIIEEGIFLYDTELSEFVKPIELTPRQLLDRALEYYDIWYPMACDFLMDGQNSLERHSLRVSNFYLHQAAEHLYATILLVNRGFKPKSHNLQNLREYSKHLNPELYFLFFDPDQVEQESNVFKNLKKGYIDARYKKTYSISEADLRDMLQKVQLMKKIVEDFCEKELLRLKALI